MQYTATCLSPLGRILLAADDTGLTGLWFEGQKYYAHRLSVDHKDKITDVILLAKSWLAIYFSGKDPGFPVPLHLTGTPFQNEVWEILSRIPYGCTCTYGDIARQIAANLKRERMSAQAVGSAVGHNPISIIVPCHRVTGASGSLTGYAGGLVRKQALLDLERTSVLTHP